MDDFLQFHPLFQTKLRTIFRELRALGWRPKIGSGLRTSGEQAEKVRLGYSKTMASWHVRSTIGILPLNKRSYDVVYGNAADIVDERYGWGGVATNRNFQFWKDLGRIAKQQGCEWGGDWTSFPDVAHIQMLYIEEAPHTTAFV